MTTAAEDGPAKATERERMVRDLMINDKVGCRKKAIIRGQKWRAQGSNSGVIVEAKSFGESRGADGILAARRCGEVP